jgi:hypothetical protein
VVRRAKPRQKIGPKAEDPGTTLYAQGMDWKARLDGHGFDLDTLVEIFREGDPVIGRDDDGYYMSSSAFDGLEEPVAVKDHAEILLRAVNGLGRLLDASFEPVRLSGSFKDEGRAQHPRRLGRLRPSAVASIGRDGHRRRAAATAPAATGSELRQARGRRPGRRGRAPVPGVSGRTRLVLAVEGLRDHRKCSRRSEGDRGGRVGDNGGSERLRRLREPRDSQWRRCSTRPEGESFRSASCEDDGPPRGAAVRLRPGEVVA